jgi:hypothetical protein
MAFLCVSQQGEFKNTIKQNLGKTCQKLLAEKVEIFFFFPFVFSQRLCAFLNKGSSKTPLKTYLGEAHVKNFWPKKLRKKTFFLSPFVFSHRFFFIAFFLGRFSA